MNKNKINNFKRLANNRVNKALVMLKLIGNLSNRSHYAYSDTDIKTIISALEKEIKSIKEKFKNSRADKKNVGFQLE
jgi:hypothetical protein